MDTVLMDLLRHSQDGDEQAREELISRHRAFIRQAASRVCRRPLDWHNDDELSVSLLAFNEAIDTFNPEAGRSFLGHASMVIHHRLVDWFRRQPAQAPLLLDGAVPDEEGDDGAIAPLEAGPAASAYREQEDMADRADDLARYDLALRRYGTSLAELGVICPRHRDTRLSLQRAAARLASDAALMRSLTRKGQLPIKQLQGVTGLSRKVLETGRKYIIAVALILGTDDYTHLKGFIKLEPTGTVASNGEASPGQTGEEGGRAL
ncbi:MAG: sigma factor [Bacillota bacterium]